MKMHRSIRNSRAAQILLLVLVSLVVFELVSKGALYFILGFKEGNYAHHYENDPKLDLITWTEKYSPHPYFGYESPTIRASEKVLSEVGDDDFVIGILGGSVAGSFGRYSRRNHSIFESMREAIPAMGRRISASLISHWGEGNNRSSSSFPPILLGNWTWSSTSMG